MEHLAIDLGGRESQICLRGADGTILREARVPTKQVTVHGGIDMTPLSGI